MSEEKPSVPDISHRRPVSGLVLAAILILIALAMQTAVVRHPIRRLADAIRYPYQLDAEEGYLLAQAIRVKTGEGLYLPIEARPYVVDNYPPAYPVAWSFFANPDVPSLAAGRWLSVMGEALTLLALAAAIATMGWYSLLRRTASSEDTRLRWWLAALLPAALGLEAAVRFVNTFEVIRWSAYARVDMLAIGLTTLGLSVFFIGEMLREKQKWTVGLRVAGFALMLLALLTKQTALAAPGACILWLLFYKEWKRLLKYALSGAIILLILTLALNIMTQGRYWLHTVIYNRNVMNWGQLWLETRGMFRSHMPLIVGFMVAGTGLLARKFLEHRTHREKPSTATGKMPIVLFTSYLLLNLLSLLSLAKAGAAENYKIEPHAAVSLFLAASVLILLRPLASPRRSHIHICTGFGTVALVLLAIYAWSFSVGRRVEGACLTAPRPTFLAYQQGEKITRMIGDADGDVLCEDPIYLLEAGKPIVMQNFIMSQLAKEGRWNQELVTGPMRRGEISLVVALADLREEGFYPRYTDDMIEIIRDQYELAAFFPRTERPEFQFIAAPFFVFRYRENTIENPTRTQP